MSPHARQREAWTLRSSLDYDRQKYPEPPPKAPEEPIVFPGYRVEVGWTSFPELYQ